MGKRPVRIPSDRSGNGRVGAPGCASDLFIFHPHVSLPPFQFSTLAHRLLKHRCKTLANESHSFPPSQPPFLSILLTFYIHFPVHLVQRRPVYPLLTNAA